MSADKTTASYDCIAVRYATREIYPLTQELNRFKELMPNGGLTLDIGCGPGQYAQALESRGLRVVAIDLSKGMLRQAQVNEPLRLVCADMRHLPTADECADGCFACASLLHIPRPQVLQTLVEFRRVLRSGGALYVSVKEGAGEEWATAPHGYARSFTYYRAKEIDQLIRAADFEVVDGWISPPGKGQRHNWINRFAIARP
jgi:ubiquinone/menaquinone biosynthesis C-methylase UbiE